MNRRSFALAGLGVAALAAGTALSLGAPRITLVNAGVRVDYPRRRAACAGLAAAGAALVALAIPRRAARVAGAIAAAALVGSASEILLYRLEADGGGVHRRGLLGRTDVAWRDVTRVDSGADAVVIWGRGETQVRVDTQAFEPTQRAMFDRTVARRVRESQAPTAAGR